MPIFNIIGKKWKPAQRIVQKVDDGKGLRTVLPAMSRKLGIPSMKNYIAFCCNEDKQPIGQLDMDTPLEDQGVEPMGYIYVSPADATPKNANGDELPMASSLRTGSAQADSPSAAKGSPDVSSGTQQDAQPTTLPPPAPVTAPAPPPPPSAPTAAPATAPPPPAPVTAPAPHFAPRAPLPGVGSRPVPESSDHGGKVVGFYDELLAPVTEYVSGVSPYASHVPKVTSLPKGTLYTTPLFGDVEFDKSAPQVHTSPTLVRSSGVTAVARKAIRLLHTATDPGRATISPPRWDTQDVTPSRGESQEMEALNPSNRCSGEPYSLHSAIPKTDVVKVKYAEPLLSEPEVVSTMSGLVLPEDVEKESETARVLASTTPEEGGCRATLLRIASLVINSKPKNPELFIWSHLQGRQLSQSATAVEKNAGCSVRSTPTCQLPVGMRRGSSGAPIAPAARGLTPCGDTVVEQLISVGEKPLHRDVLLNIACSLLCKKPTDPKVYIWSRLEGRCFAADGDSSAGGKLLADFLGEDPTVTALMKDIPAGTPAYAAVANLVELLFTRYPSDPSMYMWYHLNSKSRSFANSLRSSVNAKVGLFDPVMDSGSVTTGSSLEESSSNSPERTSDSGLGDADYQMVSGKSNAVVSFTTSVQRCGGSCDSFGSNLATRVSAGGGSVAPERRPRKSFGTASSVTFGTDSSSRDGGRGAESDTRSGKCYSYDKTSSPKKKTLHVGPGKASERASIGTQAGSGMISADEWRCSEEQLCAPTTDSAEKRACARLSQSTPSPSPQSNKNFVTPGGNELLDSRSPRELLSLPPSFMVPLSTVRSWSTRGRSAELRCSPRPWMRYERAADPLRFGLYPLGRGGHSSPSPMRMETAPHNQPQPMSPVRSPLPHHQLPEEPIDLQNATRGWEGQLPPSQSPPSSYVDLAGAYAYLGHKALRTSAVPREYAEPPYELEPAAAAQPSGYHDRQRELDMRQVQYEHDLALRREELRREQLVNEVAELQAEKAHRERMALHDGSAYATMAASAAAQVQREAEGNLAAFERSYQQVQKRFPSSLHRFSPPGSDPTVTGYSSVGRHPSRDQHGDLSSRGPSWNTELDQIRKRLEALKAEEARISQDRGSGRVLGAVYKSPALQRPGLLGVPDRFSPVSGHR